MIAVLLAAIDSTLIAMVVFAAIGIINWLAQKAQAGGEQKEMERETPETARPPTDRDAEEEERLRKFLDALGIPADQAPTRPPPRTAATPAPMQAPTQPRPMRQRVASPRAPAPPPLPKPAPRVFEEFGSTPLDVPDAPDAPDDFGAPTPMTALAKAREAASVFAGFPALTSQIAAHEASAERAQLDAYRQVAPGSAGAPAPFAGLFSNTDDVRRAMVLREVLGAPRGLQSLDSIPGI